MTLGGVLLCPAMMGDKRSWIARMLALQNGIGNWVDRRSPAALCG